MRARAVLLVAATAAWWCVGAVSARAAGGDITVVCPGTVTGTTFTLTADCDTTATLTVPAGFTVNGAGHEITAHDPDPAAGPSGLFLGAVLTNADTTMNLTNLTVRGTGFTAFGCNAGATPTVGVLYNNASGTISDVRVLDITQHATCQTVHSIQLRADAGPQTVTITSSTVADYQRTGLLVQGDVSLHASGSTFGPPDPTVPNPGGIAQNSVQIGSPALAAPSSGTFTDNTVIGGAFGRPGNTSLGLLIANAADLTVSGNIFAGAGMDAGIGFFAPNRAITIAYNRIDRSAPDRPGFDDAFGFGVNADAGSSPQTTLICNTFAGWNRNLNNITQPPCILTAPALPCATADTPVDLRLHADVAAPHPDVTWSLISGELPPGLALHPDGTITGTATETGTTTATLKASDPVEGSVSGTFTFCVKAATPSPAPAPPTTHVPAPGLELARTGTHTTAPASIAAALLASGLLLRRRVR